MVEMLVLAWCSFVLVATIRFLLIGRIQFKALNIKRDIVDAGIMNGAIDIVDDIELLYDNLEKRGYFTMTFDLTRWTLRGFYPELARWEAARK